MWSLVLASRSTIQMIERRKNTITNEFTNLPSVLREDLYPSSPLPFPSTSHHFFTFFATPLNNHRSNTLNTIPPAM